jgi:general secretion pathway protein M
MSDRLGRLREKVERLAPRERRLLVWLLITLAVMVVLVVPVTMSFALSARRDTNKVLREAIATLKSSRETVKQRQAKRDAVLARYANKAPPLAGLLEKAARDNQLEIPESLDRPDVPHGKKYTERVTVVRLRKARMLSLAKMLEEVEQQQMPLSISRLNIRRRGGESDSYDVEIGLSAFDRTEGAKGGAEGAKGGSGAAPGGTK